MLVGLVLTLITVAAGAAVGMLSRGDFSAVRFEFLLVPLLTGWLLMVLARRWLAIRINPTSDWTVHFRIAAGVLIASIALVIASETAITLSVPTAAGISVAVGLALVYAGGWLGQSSSIELTKFAVLSVYAACAVTSGATLVTALPPSAFWVVSALIPAWQARKYSKLNQLAPALRFVGVAVWVYVSILICALGVPVLLLLR